MSRVERDFVAREEANEPDLANLVDRLAALNGGKDEDRREAIVCLLSGSDGWREAADRLSGAFASDGSNVRPLSQGGTQE